MKLLSTLLLLPLLTFAQIRIDQLIVYTCDGMCTAIEKRGDNVECDCGALSSHIIMEQICLEFLDEVNKSLDDSLGGETSSFYLHLTKCHYDPDFQEGGGSSAFGYGSLYKIKHDQSITNLLNHVGADIVHLISGVKFGGGSADINAGDPLEVYAVSAQRFEADDRLFRHETGHVLGCDHSDGDGHDSERTIMASSCDSDTYTYTCETVLRYSSTCYGIMKSNSPWISGFRDDVACPLGEDGDAPQEPDESCYEPVCLPVRDGISGIYSFRLKENDDCIIGFSEPCVSSGNSCEPLAPNCCHGNCQTSTYTCP